MKISHEHNVYHIKRQWNIRNFSIDSGSSEDDPRMRIPLEDNNHYYFVYWTSVSGAIYRRWHGDQPFMHGSTVAPAGRRGPCLGTVSTASLCHTYKLDRKGFPQRAASGLCAHSQRGSKVKNFCKLQ